MWRKRATGWLVIAFIGICLLITRLVQLQLWQTEDFSEHHVNLIQESVEQRTQEVIVNNGRGKFVDRNGIGLTHETKPVLILFPFLKRMVWDIDRVADIVNVPKATIERELAESKEPIALGGNEPILLTETQMVEINELKIPGVFAINKQYDLSTSMAEQLIGFIGENEKEFKKRYPDKEQSPKTLIGVSGLQQAFDPFLIPEGETKLVYHVDARNGPLFGIDVKYVDPANPYYPVQIKTTIDSTLQQRAEQLLDEYEVKKGGLVLLDIQSNEVLALVSRPHIDANDPYANNGAKNQMVTSQIIGSVFKTVVATAAVDYNLDGTDRLFDCSKKINGDPDLKYDYGMLNFEESFARSCNNTFGSLAKELKDIDPYIIETYAKNLGLLGPVGWQGNIYHLEDFKQLPNEGTGRVFTSEQNRLDDNFVKMSGIGQHEVRATPLGVANMMATIARGGQAKMIRVVSDIEYKNGTSMVKFEDNALDGSIAPYTAMKIQRLLREVVTNNNGTGRWFQDLPYEIAGKSGTAETGIMVDNRQLHNKWFAGYFPFNQPQYALVVVNLGVFEDEGGMNPVFANMVKEIYDYNYNINK